MSSDALIEFEEILKQLNSTPVGRRTFLAAVPALMAACASPQKTRYREGSNEGQASSISVDDEKRMTREALVEMRKDYPALKDQETQNYVSDLGRKLVLANHLEGNPYNYTFTVVDVKQVNAFALPAGTIFVTAPLITLAESEAELAGVVGHEIGHVKARHAAERIEAVQKESGNNWLYAVGGGILGGAAGFGLGKLLCSPNDSACVQRAMQVGAAAGIGGGLLIQKYKFMANSREDEMEADRIGFRTATAAGYSGEHVGQFYTKLLKMEEKSKAGGGGVLSSLSDAMSTHPPSKERVAQMQEMAAQTRVKGLVTTQGFLKIRGKLQQMGKQA